MSRVLRWSMVAALAAACSNSDLDSESHFLCSRDADCATIVGRPVCAGGQCEAAEGGLADAATHVDAATHGDASPDDATTSVDAGLPPVLEDVCFDVPSGSTGELRAPEPVGQAGGWAIASTFVARGGNGFALWLAKDGSNQGVYLDRAGGCVRPITSAVGGGPSFGLFQPVAGPGTLAALVGCGYKGFACTRALYRNGVRLTTLPLGHSDATSRWTDGIAAATDGALFVATGPRTPASFTPILNAIDEPPYADTLDYFWVPAGGALTTATSQSDQSSVLVAVDTVDDGAFHAAALVLREVAEGGLGGSHVVLQPRDGSTTRWDAPREVVVTGLSARGDGIALMGTTTAAGQQRGWFGVLGARDLAVRWEATASATAGLPFGVGLANDGRLVAATTDASAVIQVIAYDAAGATTSSGADYRPPDAGIFYPTSFGVAPDGTLLLAAGDRVASLAAP